MFFRSIRAEPGTRIWLRQRQLVGDPDFLKGPVALIFVPANPPAVRGQADPQNREAQKSPARFLNLPRRLQNETVEEDILCREQSPGLKSEKCRDRRAPERHQERDESVNASDAQKTSQKHDRSENFLRPG